MKKFFLLQGVSPDVSKEKCKEKWPLTAKPLHLMINMRGMALQWRRLQRKNGRAKTPQR
ncbi:hypothetical protein [Salicibibacter halophilus]|uniref:hypothetical protein n=1 Tax=Salicibibacter halophilus TaxID=2502791 RepID=UPI00135C6619|nr:hypothetical protein [Salicibibacter halophilus]